MLLQSIAVLVSVLVRSAQYGDQYTKINQKRRKVPDFLRNQELFGGDYWTRTSEHRKHCVKSCTHMIKTSILRNF